MMRPVTSKSRLSKGGTTHKHTDSVNDDLGHMAISGKELSTGAAMPKYRGMRMTIDEDDAKKPQKLAGKASAAAGLSQPRQRKGTRPATGKETITKTISASTVGFGKGFPKTTPTTSKTLKKSKELDLFASGQGLNLS